jgi:hypothetical protein
MYSSRPGAATAEQSVFPAPPPAITDKLHKGSSIRITGVIDSFVLKPSPGGSTEHFIGGPATGGVRSYVFRVTISAAKVSVDE